MNNHRDKLIESISLYIKKNKLDNDTTFYKIEDWIERGEEYLTDSDFVITSEGGLYSIINYGDSDEFYDLIESFGYYMEMGHAWSYGFYFDEELIIDNSSDKKTYSEKLRDERWENKRHKVKEKAGFLCEDCGNNTNLEVHHCYYKYGLEPWQYPLDSLRCLCSNCHDKRGKIEMEIRARMADLKTNELEMISELLYGGMKYYPENKISDLIKNLGINKEKLRL